MADSYGALDPGSAARPPEIDLTKPHPARIYDYFLGGKDNFAADRATAAQVLDSWGSVRTAVRENRAFLGRAVRYLAEEAAITLVSEWRNEAGAIRPLPSEVSTYGGVARKP